MNFGKWHHIFIINQHSLKIPCFSLIIRDNTSSESVQNCINNTILNLIMNTDFKITSGSNLSFWTEVTEPIKFDQLKNDLSCNAVVIGGELQD